MPVDAMSNFSHNSVSVWQQMRVVKNVPCLALNLQGLPPGDILNDFFVYAQSVLRTIAVSLHGLLGVKHWLALTPAARHPNSQRGIGQHALDQGGRQQVHGRNRWLMATLAGTSNAPCGRGWLASTPGKAMPERNAELSSRANGG